MEWRRRTKPYKAEKGDNVPPNNVTQRIKVVDIEPEQLPDWELAKRKSAAKSGLANIRGDISINVVNGFSPLSYEIVDITVEKGQYSYQGNTGDPKSKQPNK